MSLQRWGREAAKVIANCQEFMAFRQDLPLGRPFRAWERDGRAQKKHGVIRASPLWGFIARPLGLAV